MTTEMHAQMFGATACVIVTKGTSAVAFVVTNNGQTRRPVYGPDDRAWEAIAEDSDSDSVAAACRFLEARFGPRGWQVPLKALPSRLGEPVRPGERL
jgi:hypothetical protein